MTNTINPCNERNEELKYCYKYPHPSVTTDCVIFGFDGKKLQVLLVQRGNEPYKGCWAFPGGFMNMDESAEEGALRELQEETGLKDAYIRQFHTFTAPQRDPRERRKYPLAIAHDHTGHLCHRTLGRLQELWIRISKRTWQPEKHSSCLRIIKQPLYYLPALSRK